MGIVDDTGDTTRNDGAFYVDNKSHLRDHLGGRLNKSVILLFIWYSSLICRI